MVSGLAVAVTMNMGRAESKLLKFPSHRKIYPLIDKDKEIQKIPELIAIANQIAKVVELRTLLFKDLESIVQGAVKQQFRYDKIAEEVRKKHVETLLKFFAQYKKIDARL